jgi:anti-anti-sigma factor
MEILENRDEHGICLRITRTLDLTNSPDLNQVLEKLFDATLDPIWIDVSGLLSVDSAGLTLLLKWHRRALAEERRFAFVRTTHYHRKLLEITRLDKQLVVFDEPGGKRVAARPAYGLERKASRPDDPVLELVGQDSETELVIDET